MKPLIIALIVAMFLLLGNKREQDAKKQYAAVKQSNKILHDYLQAKRESDSAREQYRESVVRLYKHFNETE